MKGNREAKSISQSHNTGGGVLSALYRYVYCRTGDPAAAEEIAGLALAQAGKKGGGGREPSSPGLTFLHIADGLILQRKKVRENSPAAGAKTSAASERHQLLLAVHSLPDLEQRVLLLRYVEGLGIRETAAVLKCPEEAVRKAASRGLRNLRDRLGEIPTGYPPRASASPG